MRPLAAIAVLALILALGAGAAKRPAATQEGTTMQVIAVELTAPSTEVAVATLPKGTYIGQYGIATRETWDQGAYLALHGDERLLDIGTNEDDTDASIRNAFSYEDETLVFRLEDENGNPYTGDPPTTGRSVAFIEFLTLP